MRLGEEEQPDKVRAQSTDDQDMTSGLEKVIVRQMKCTSSGVGRTRPPEKGEGRGNKGKKNMEDSEAKQGRMRQDGEDDPVQVAWSRWLIHPGHIRPGRKQRGRGGNVKRETTQ